MNTEQILKNLLEKDTNEIHTYLEKYKLTLSDKLSAIHIVFNDWQFRVLASERQEDQKMKKVQLYNFSKKMVERCENQEEIYQIREDFIRLVLLLQQKEALDQALDMEYLLDSPSPKVYAKTMWLKKLIN